MTREQRWAQKMDLARQLANLHQVRMRIECKTWQLSDGAVKREYLLSRTGQKLWSTPTDRAHPLP